MIRFCRQAVDMRINTPQDNFELDYYFDYLAEGYLNSGKEDEFSKLTDTLDYLRKDNKTKAYLLNKLGNFKANSNLNNEAIEYYENAIKLHKTPIYYGNLGIMYSRLSNWDQMIEYFSRAVKQRLERSDDTTQISYYLKYLAKAYYKLNKIPRFISFLNLIDEMNAHPEEKATVINQIGNFYGDDKNYSKAIHFYKTAIKLNNLAVYLNNLGHAYDKYNKPEKALETFLVALDVRKQQLEGEIPLSEYYENVAIMYNKTGKIERFEEFFEKETDLDAMPEQKSIIYNGIGILFYKKKDWEKAILNYQKAIDLDDKAIYELNLGLVYGELKNWDLMIELCKKAIEIRRNKFDKEYSMRYYYEFLAQAYYNSKNATEFIDYIEANDDFKDDQASKDVVYDYISGQFLVHINPKGAMDFFKKALEHNDNSKHRYKLAEAYRFSGNKEEALKQYKICLKQQILNHEPLKKIFSTCSVLEACDIGVQNKKAKDFLNDSLLEIDISEEEKELLINDFENYKVKVQK
jgi:tetratricopeptide (TPR) repeat protein